MRLVARLEPEDVGTIWNVPGEPARVPNLHSRVSGVVAMDAALWQALEAEAPATLRPAWAALRSPDALAVVTGQQPGCAGGVLLTLYKVATAVALARAASAELGRPVVPVYWNAADDDDFDEVSRVAWPDAERGLLFLELPPTGRSVGGWVGDLPASGDRDAVVAVLDQVTPERAVHLSRFRFPDARDHGEWVAAFFGAIFDELVVVDGRSAALRRFGAPLFHRYLEHQDEVQEAIEARAREILERGGKPAIAPGSARQALFVTPARRREKTQDPELLRQVLERSPEHVSPNVVLRALLQDTALPTLAHVVGPSEMRYLRELQPLRALLGVPEPALVPRLALTLLEEQALQAALDTGVSLPDLLRSPDAALQARAAPWIHSASASIAGAFGTLQDSLDAMPFEPHISQRARRRLESLQAELENAVSQASRARAAREAPDLARLGAWLRPRDQPQERSVAGLWLSSRWGETTGAKLVDLARQHLESTRQGWTPHCVVTL